MVTECVDPKEILDLGMECKKAEAADASKYIADLKKLLQPIPTPEVVEPLRCVNSGSLQKSIYHGQDLLPAVLSHDMWMLTPF